MGSYQIGVITDSTCDIPPVLLEKYGIIVVSHRIIWGEEQYRDRVDMRPVEFYQRLLTDPRRPTSTHANPMDFQRAIEEAAIRGAEKVIIITVSGAMSGAFQTAQIAANSVQIPTTVVDARGPTMTVGWQALVAARAAYEGASMAAILNRVEEVRNKLVQFVGMDTLEYLQRGGRIGNAVKWVGMKLQVKPLVTINHQTGLVEPVGLVRTHDALVDLLYKKFFERLQGGKNLRVAVLHGNAQSEADALAERIKAEYNPLELLVNITGPVLGINTGPGALALCGYTEG